MQLYRKIVLIGGESMKYNRYLRISIAHFLLFGIFLKGFSFEVGYIGEHFREVGSALSAAILVSLLAGSVFFFALAIQDILTYFKIKKIIRYETARLHLEMPEGEWRSFAKNEFKRRLEDSIKIFIKLAAYISIINMIFIIFSMLKIIDKANGVILEFAFMMALSVVKLLWDITKAVFFIIENYTAHGEIVLYSRALLLNGEFHKFDGRHRAESFFDKDMIKVSIKTREIVNNKTIRIPIPKGRYEEVKRNISLSYPWIKEKSR